MSKFSFNSIKRIIKRFSFKIITTPCNNLITSIVKKIDPDELKLRKISITWDYNSIVKNLVS